MYFAMIVCFIFIHAYYVNMLLFFVQIIMTHRNLKIIAKYCISDAQNVSKIVVEIIDQYHSIQVQEHGAINNDSFYRIKRYFRWSEVFPRSISHVKQNILILIDLF